MCFAVDDLFVVGISLEIVGAYLLGRGLLTSSKEIARRATSYVGYSGPLAVSQSEDKVDGAFGLGALVLGFATQAVAYAVTLRRDTVNEGSLARAATAIALAALAGASLLVLWRVVRMRLIKRQVVKVARVNVFRLPVEIMERPYGRLLVDYGEELGFPLERETVNEYAERVFGVTDIEPGGPKTEETPRVQEREES